MEVKTDLTSKDYADFNRYLFNKRNLKKYILLSICISLMLPYATAHNAAPTLYDFVFYFVVFNSAFIGYLYFYLSRTRKTPMKDGMFLGERKYIVHENEFICEKDNGESTVKWSAIKSIDISAKAIYLFVDTNSAFIIPKRAFADAQSQNEFVETINSKVGLE